MRRIRHCVPSWWGVQRPTSKPRTTMDIKLSQWLRQFAAANESTFEPEHLTKLRAAAQEIEILHGTLQFLGIKDINDHLS